MIYNLLVTDPQDPTYFSETTVEAESLQAAIQFIMEHNDNKIASEKPAPTVDVDAIKSAIVAAVQDRLDQTAQTRGYDGIVSLCTYAASSVPRFKAEALAGVDWRDACWATCYQIMADVQGGLRGLPTPDEVLAELPQIGW